MNQTNEIINIFYESINPDINYQNVTTRQATNEMIKRYTYQGTFKMATRVVKAQKASNARIANGEDNDFCPTAITPYEMRAKLPKFKAYFDKIDGEKKKKAHKMPEWKPPKIPTEADREEGRKKLEALRLKFNINK